MPQPKNMVSSNNFGESGQGGSWGKRQEWKLILIRLLVLGQAPEDILLALVWRLYCVIVALNLKKLEADLNLKGRGECFSWPYFI